MGPTFDIELQSGKVPVAGVDEVGRGPWAGPVTAAAVILDPAAIPEGLNDSKKLSEAARNRLAAEIHACAQVSIASATVAEIDAINILQASMLAMRRAIAGLTPAPAYVLVDGNRLPDELPCPGQAVVKGDGRSLSIAAASIVAKVHRDAYMRDLARQHPHFGWETNMGYGTQKHRMGLLCHGVTPHHRRSFKPIHNMLCE